MHFCITLLKSLVTSCFEGSEDSIFSRRFNIFTGRILIRVITIHLTTDREQHSTRAFLLNRFVLHYTELWETAYSATSILSSALVWAAVSLRARVHTYRAHALRRQLMS